MFEYSTSELDSQAQELRIATGATIATEPSTYITEEAANFIGTARTDFDALAKLLEDNNIEPYDAMKHLAMFVAREDEITNTNRRLLGCYIPTPEILEAEDGEEHIHYPVIVVTASSRQSTQEKMNETALHEVGHLVHHHERPLYSTSNINRVRAIGGVASMAAASMLGAGSESLILGSIVAGAAIAGGVLAASPTSTRKTIRTFSRSEHVADRFAYKHRDVQLITLDS